MARGEVLGSVVASSDSQIFMYERSKKPSPLEWDFFVCCLHLSF